MGRIAIEADLEFADLASSPEVEWDFEAAYARARATDLACWLKDDALRRRAAGAVLSMVERYASEGRWRGLLEPLEYIVRKRKVFTEANEARARSRRRSQRWILQPDAGADPQQSDRPERGQDR